MEFGTEIRFLKAHADSQPPHGFFISESFKCETKKTNEDEKEVKTADVKNIGFWFYFCIFVNRTLVC